MKKAITSACRVLAVMLRMDVDPWLKEQDDSCKEFRVAQAVPVFCVASERSLPSLLQCSVLLMLPRSTELSLCPHLSVAACWAEVGHSSLQAITQTGMSFFFIKVCYLLSRTDKASLC